MPSKNAALQLAKNLLSLYDISTYSDETVEQLYDINALFNDPLVEVAGIDNIKAQFRSLAAIATNSEILLIRGSLSGGDTLTIESRVSYSLKPFPKFMKISIVIFSICELDDEKIVSHTDFWDVKSILQNIPIVSFLYNRFRPVFGTVSSNVIKRLMPVKHA